MSSPSLPTSSQFPQFYQDHQLTVQRELIQQIDNQYLPDLQEVFNTPQWLNQNEPLTRETIKRFCPKDPMEKKFVCVFCPGVSFAQSTKAVEHIQQKHFKLYPFDCKRCQKTFLRNNELENHEKTHEPSLGVRCPNSCDTYFSTDKIGNINRHLREWCPLRNA